MKVSIVMVTSNRQHLLWRSLYRYANQDFADFEIIVVDDDSKDDTFPLCDEFAKVLDLKYIRVVKRKEGWRDCAMNINLGLRAAQGEVIIATHPEVIPGDSAVRLHYENRAPMRYVASKIYYLTPENQERIDMIGWSHKGTVLHLRRLPDFYNLGSAEIRGNLDYTHEATDRLTNWESWVYGSMTRETWKFFGGLQEQPEWGSVDVDFMTRRHMLGIQTHTLMDENSICAHQNHDVLDPNNPHFTLTPRNMDKAMGALRHYPTPESARLGFL
jgi:Glycosyl transferase family 2